MRGSTPTTPQQRAALEICLEHFLNDPQTASEVKTAFSNLNNSAVKILLEQAANPQFLRKRLGVAGGAISQDQDYLNRRAIALKIKEPLDYPIVVDTVLANLLNQDANISAAALDTLRKINGVEKLPEFQSAMNQLKSSSNPRLRLIAASVLHGSYLGDALRDVQPGSVLDLPILRYSNRAHSCQARTGRQGMRVLPCQPCHLQALATQCARRIL